MFLRNAFFIGNSFWKYIVGTFLLVIVFLLGQLPFSLAVFYKLRKTGDTIIGKTQNQVMHLFDKNLNLFLLLLPFVFAFIAIFLIVKMVHKQKITQVITSRSKIDWNRYFFSFGIWAIFQVIVTGVMYYFSPSDYQWNFQLIPFLKLVLVGGVLLPIQTATEELLFRGYLMQGFGLLTKNKGAALMLTSIIFGGMHYFNPEVEKLGPIVMIYYIGTGLFLGVLTLMDNGMELSLGFHSANNLIAALLVTSDWSALQTYSVLKDVSAPSIGIEVIAPIVVIFPVLLFVFYKKYKWNNWEDKLTGSLILQTNND